MLRKLRAAWALMHAGKRLADPVPIKKGQINASHLKLFFIALVGAYTAFTGSDIEIGEHQLDALAVGIASVVAAGFEVFNILATYASTNKLGVDGERPPQ